MSPSSLTNEGLSPPANFSMVGNSGFVYRSSFPKPENFPYLQKLKLKTIITLVSDTHPAENNEFMRQNGIKHYQIAMPGKKVPFVNSEFPDEKILTALRIILDRRNHPILIHCNKGKHRTGCVVGCLRKVQAWSLTLIFDEYRRFAGHKSRALDQLKIELFREEACMGSARRWGWIPPAIMSSGCSMQEFDEECTGIMDETVNLPTVKA
ncbi:protein-tyrosine phosphatase [Choiromyces venosus 120613-1]|uniref:diphosphoinositol-polyphosphate diphosphatase n=1 Tax=Choiromyces venosus 120613-1 TaxID=1336337 RepID=A0A3N4K9G8_9PEZI|nr:protein-tyrosine phosphatase [Choiromyces venosus 120613-1]